MIILWDIDGTLVDVRGAGRRSFIDAIERAWGIRDTLEDVSFAGATDLGVLEQLRARLALHEEHTGRFFDHMVDALTAHLRAAPAHAYPFAIDTITAFAQRGVRQGLLTGNEERCARIKLRSAGIDDTPLTFGAFGHEHASREELARIAKARAGEGPIVVVGDTKRDIDAARAIGATAIAVCTGHATRADLVGADHVLDDLSQLLAIDVVGVGVARAR